MVPSPGVSTVASVLAFYVVLGADRSLNVTSDLIGFIALLRALILILCMFSL